MWAARVSGHSNRRAMRPNSKEWTNGMRLLPILTALLVAVVLYAAIMERDQLKAFANGGTPVETAPDAPPQVLAAESADQPIAVVVLKSTKRAVENGIVLSGRTEAARKVEVRAETTGRIVSEPIGKGATITKGDTLCELDPGTSTATMAEAQAQLREAETNLRTAESLAERGFSSETDTISRKSQLESAMAGVERAKTEIERLTIRAPFDGILETNTAELGELMQPGSACATLISLDPIKLVGYVPEQSVEKLVLDGDAGGRLVTGKELLGKVSFISRSADEVTRTFRVEISVPNPDRSIRDGVTAEILIGLKGEEGHLLPQSALTLNDAGELGVRTNEDGIAHFSPVILIRDDKDGIWVTGLPDEVEVIITGQDFVREGRAINVSYQEDDT